MTPLRVKYSPCLTDFRLGQVTRFGQQDVGGMAMYQFGAKALRCMASFYLPSWSCHPWKREEQATGSCWSFSLGSKMEMCRLVLKWTRSLESSLVPLSQLSSNCNQPAHPHIIVISNETGELLVTHRGSRGLINTAPEVNRNLTPGIPNSPLSVNGEKPCIFTVKMAEIQK